MAHTDSSTPSLVSEVLSKEHLVETERRSDNRREDYLVALASVGDLTDPIKYSHHYGVPSDPRIDKVPPSGTHSDGSKSRYTMTEFNEGVRGAIYELQDRRSYHIIFHDQSQNPIEKLCGVIVAGKLDSLVEKNKLRVTEANDFESKRELDNALVSFRSQLDGKSIEELLEMHDEYRIKKTKPDILFFGEIQKAINERGNALINEMEIFEDRAIRKLVREEYPGEVRREKFKNFLRLLGNVKWGNIYFEPWRSIRPKLSGEMPALLRKLEEYGADLSEASS